MKGSTCQQNSQEATLFGDRAEEYLTAIAVLNPAGPNVAGSSRSISSDPVSIVTSVVGTGCVDRLQIEARAADQEGVCHVKSEFTGRHLFDACSTVRIGCCQSPL